MKTVIVCLFLLTVCISSMGQESQEQNEFFSYGFNAGVFGWASAEIKRIDGNYPAPGRRMNSGIEQKTDKNGKTRYVPVANTSMGLNAAYSVKTKTKDLFSFQIEIQRNRMSYRFIMPVAATMPGANFSTWVESDVYLDYLTSVQYNWLHNLREHRFYDEYHYVRVSSGACFFHRNYGYKLRKDAEEDWTEDGKGLKTKITSVNPASIMIAAEMGKKIFSNKRNTCLDIGLVVYYPLINTFTKEYEFFNNGVSLGKSRISYKGSAVMFNIRYSFNVNRKQKTLQDTSLKEPTTEVFEIRSVNGRKVEVQKVTTLERDSVDIFVWDKNELDGDKIALYFNNQLILPDHDLLRTKKKISVCLVKGSNYLVIHAIDLGTTPPVTTAVKIAEHEISRNALIISNEQESGAWKIIYKPRKKNTNK